MIKPFVLIILDGWGHRDDTKHNAIAAASTPFYDSLLQTYPHSLLDASQENVGLPQGQMGNSEIGHMTIGAGRIIDTDLVKISKAIKNNEFGKNPAFLQLFEHVKKHGSFLHILGLVSPGGVHSHEDHLHAFLRAAKDAEITKIIIHAFTDGRDTPPQSASQSLKKLESLISDLGIGFIATASGRFYAMDRDKNWDRLARFENVLFEKDHGEKVIANKKPSEAYEELYAEGQLDEHIKPMVFLDETGKSYQVQDNDGIFFFNFRSDRARQLAEKISVKSQSGNLFFVTMTEYGHTPPSIAAFPKDELKTTLAAEISKAGLIQTHIAETEKYAHATFFLNGGRDEPHSGETHILIESRKDIATHDLAPKMRAEQIADKAIEQLAAGTDFIFINFANADMVGHTGNVPALIEAIQEIDKQLERVVQKVLELGGTAVITADHGNAEQNIDPVTNEKHTAHTTNPVPFILAGNDARIKTARVANGNLADIAPTILELLEISKPDTMTGKNLVV